jgi:DNA-binding transcriptional LysR family regulator
VDQLEAMRVFVAISEAGSLSAAGRALGVPVAGVSRRLAALEAHLGARLLSRSTRRMALTEAGRRYLEACRRVVAEVAEADRSAGEESREPQGLLGVTAPVLFGRLHVLPVVVELLRAHPRLDVRLVLDDHNVDLIDAGLDVAVRIGALPDSALVATRVGSVRRISCASPAYLRARGTPARPEDLAAHDCVSFDAPAGSARGRWSYPSKRGLRSVAVRSRLAVASAEAAVEAASAGLGITRVLSYQAQAAIAAGRLAPVLERFEPPALPVHLLHGEGRTPRPRLRAFLTLAAARLRAALR